MQPLSEFDLVGRLLAAAVLGAVLGFERSLAGKHAGMRTYALVSLGSCLFVLCSVMAAFGFAIFPAVNPLYIAASVVVGIGFIGAGLAALRGEHPELTTGTGIWVAAGVGMASGFGLWDAAIAATVIGVLIFWLLAKVEHYVRLRFRGYQSEQ